MWIHKPPRQAKPKVPDTIKLDVEAKAREIVETILKPEHVKPPPKDKNFNYIVDVYSKWYRNYFYLCTKYACPSPNAVSPFFEAKFARLEYVGNGRFNLSYFFHAAASCEIYTDLSLDECIATIRDESHFIP